MNIEEARPVDELVTRDLLNRLGRPPTADEERRASAAGHFAARTLDVVADHRRGAASVADIGFFEFGRDATALSLFENGWGGDALRGSLFADVLVLGVEELNPDQVFAMLAAEPAGTA